MTEEYNNYEEIDETVVEEIPPQPVAPEAPEPNFSASQQVEYDYSAQANDSNVFGIISLICGIVSLIVCCCFTPAAMAIAIAAVVLGIISIKKEESMRGLAVGGIVCGGISLLIAVILLIIGGLFNLLAGSFTYKGVDLEDYLDGLFKSNL